jgi:hypothetical protein
MEMSSLHMDDEDRLSLPEGDFRRERALLAPHVFVLPGDKPDFPPRDLVPQDDWSGVMDLPTDVAIRTSSHQGQVFASLHHLDSGWVFSWPDPDKAPMMDEPMLLAGEEFDALVFNAVHGYYRQAIGCLRNALEVMTIATGLALTKNRRLFERWRSGQEISFGQARAWILESKPGAAIEQAAHPHSLFKKDDNAWLCRLYARLCGYAHSRAGYNNADFWESNGPIHVPKALDVVELEFRETLAICYLLLKLGWPGLGSTDGIRQVLGYSGDSWREFLPLLSAELLAD